MNTCRVCEVEKPEERFEIIAHSGNRRKVCRECMIARKKEREATNPEEYEAKRRYAVLKNKYGITRQEYESKMEEQGGACAICKKPEREGRWLSVDHCHNSLKVRGLLCHTCNTAIGMFEDNPEYLTSAISYLEGSDCD